MNNTVFFLLVYVPAVIVGISIVLLLLVVGFGFVWTAISERLRSSKETEL